MFKHFIAVNDHNSMHVIQYWYKCSIISKYHFLFLFFTKKKHQQKLLTLRTSATTKTSKKADFRIILQAFITNLLYKRNREKK